METRVAILRRMQGDVGDDAYAEPETDVCFDDIRIACGERYIWCEARLRESVMQGRGTRETEHVSDDRMRGEILQRGPGLRGQGCPCGTMIRRCQR